MNIRHLPQGPWNGRLWRKLRRSVTADVWLAVGSSRYRPTRASNGGYSWFVSQIPPFTKRPIATFDAELWRCDKSRLLFDPVRTFLKPKATGPATYLCFCYV